MQHDIVEDTKICNNFAKQELSIQKSRTKINEIFLVEDLFVMISRMKQGFKHNCETLLLCLCYFESIWCVALKTILVHIPNISSGHIHAGGRKTSNSRRTFDSINRGSRRSGVVRILMLLSGSCTCRATKDVPRNVRSVLQQLCIL